MFATFTLRHPLLFIFSLFLLAGCPSGAVAPPQDAPGDSPEDGGFASEYRIGVGDALTVSVWQNPDLSGSVPVRPDGRITVALAGDIDVGGKTPPEVAEIIKAGLATYIRDPQVTVIVTQMNSAEYVSRVRVTGAVRSPRSLPYRPGMTVMDVVLEAGGVSEFASAGRTMLYREKGDHRQVALDAILERGDLSTNFKLRAGDVITVPEQSF